MAEIPPARAKHDVSVAKTYEQSDDAFASAIGDDSIIAALADNPDELDGPIDPDAEFITVPSGETTTIGHQILLGQPPLRNGGRRIIESTPAGSSNKNAK